MIEVLVRIARQAADAPKGEREQIYAAVCSDLGISRATLHRKLRAVTVRHPRKRRSDHGDFELPKAEADEISAYLMEGYRLNEKRGRTLKTAVDVLRANGKIRAERIDPNTGEVRPLSCSAIARALRGYGCHPDQLRRPTPHQPLKSLHPNHVWQVDGSVCVLYYLPGGGALIEELDPSVHYKNKPHNLRAIEQLRVIRYVLTDHCTNVTRWRYYPHAETAEHTVRFLAWAMAPKQDHRDPFHGRPVCLMVDPGATAGGLVKRFCARMGVELIVNRPRNARAKGSVENAQNRVELAFEHGLRDQRFEMRSFDALNRAADVFQLWYNATKPVERHRMTRFDAWMHIREHELIRTRPESVLLSLATDEPQKRRVRGDLTAEFKRRIWSVKEVPGVMVGGDVFLHWHPFEDCAMAVALDSDGNEMHIELPDVTGAVNPLSGHWGFQQNAAVIGREFKSRGDTDTDGERKRISMLASGARTLEEDEKARTRKGFQSFGGRIDPYKEAKGADLPEYLAKRGTDHELRIPRFEQQHLNAVQAARYVKGRMGDAWKPEFAAWLQERFGESGVTESQLDNLIRQWAGSDNARVAGSQDRRTR